MSVFYNRFALVSVAIFLTATIVVAQTPQALNYQAVARDASGAVLINQSIDVRLSVNTGSAGGTTVYQETHVATTTNPFGLFTLEVGNGVPNTGTFSNIDWGNSAKFLKVDVDFGAGYVHMGTSQLLSVPYALYARRVENDNDQQTLSISGNTLSISNGNNVNLPSGVQTLNGLTDVNTSGAVTNQVLQWNGTQWIPANLSGGTGDNWGTQTVIADAPLTGNGTAANHLRLINGTANGQVLKWNGTAWTAGTDNNTDAQTLSLSGNTLSISGGNNVTLPAGAAYTAGSGISISGSNVITAVDNSATNEIQTISKSGSTISLSNGGGSVTDADNQTLSISGNSLSISGGNSVTLPAGTAYTAGSGISILGNVISATDNSVTNEIQTLSLSGSTLSLSNGGGSVTLPGSGSAWLLTGNSTTNPATNFLGTTDNQLLRFRLNNVWAGELHPSNGNLSLGPRAAQSNTTGTRNVAIGRSALWTNTTRSGLVAIGDSALYTNGVGAIANNEAANNTAIGTTALRHNTSGFENIAVGNKTLYSNVSGSGNVAVGAFALERNTTGSMNIAIGSNVLWWNSTGSANIATGEWSMSSNTTGFDNVAYGVFSLRQNTIGNHNSAVGSNALQDNTIGYNNAAFGHSAMMLNTVGYDNTGLGYTALRNNTTGIWNTAVGSRALYNITTSSRNTGLGYNAGSTYANGNWCTFLGGYSDANAAGYSNSTAVGDVATITASNQVRVGDVYMTSIGGYAGWTNLSDGRFKKDLRQDVSGLAFVMRLTPVTYTLDLTGINRQLGVDNDKPESFQAKSKIRYTGFVAQDVQRAADSLGFDFSGVDKPKNDDDLYGLRYAEFVVPLVKAVQEQQAQIEALTRRLEALQQQLDALEK